MNIVCPQALPVFKAWAVESIRNVQSMLSCLGLWCAMQVAMSCQLKRGQGAAKYNSSPIRKICANSTDLLCS